MNAKKLIATVRRKHSLVAAFAVLTLLPSAILAEKTAKRPVLLILDTDIGNDVDDVLALGMIHALESRGECKLIAVTITKDNPLAASFTDAVNTFYGRGNIPIGICNSGVTPAKGKFIGLSTKKDGDDLRYAHDLLSSKKVPEAIAVLRNSLASAEDNSVAFVQVGFSTNLANLLKSKPDAISPLGGVELVRKKVRLLSIMAGAFTQITRGNNKPYDHKEYNVLKDIPSAQAIANAWPTPIVWSGYEIGLSAAYPHESIERDYRYVEHHPLADAYWLYNPPPHDRPTWDLTSVLYAVRPDHGYFGLSASGRATVADNSLTTFKPSSDGPHRYLKLNAAQRIRVIEALVQLSSQPPNHPESNGAE